MNLLNVTPDAARQHIAMWLEARGEPSYRADQIAPRLWNRPVRTWQDVLELPATLREALTAELPLSELTLNRRQDSLDGTVKFLWDLSDGRAVESVWIPEGRRSTLCISSQAGCAYACVFCATGRMGFQRHLEPWEIVAQVREMTLQEEFGTPNNIVFMGMGEPLHNWPGVDTALTILNHPEGSGIGARRITVSTIGLIPNLRKFAARPEQFRLAVSLHAPTSERRAAIMPVEKKYPLAELLDELEGFARRVTLEYVMIRGANDSEADAEALAGIATRLHAMVNLLPLHPGGAPGCVPTPAKDITAFAASLRRRGANVTVRRSRGLDISAACGQLRFDAETV